MRHVLVVAPHPDDETLGCGGALLRHKEDGDEIHWLIVTGIDEENGFSTDRVNSRGKEIEKVSQMYNFSSVHNLNLPTTKLDTQPLGGIVKKVGFVFENIKPEIVYVPYRGDVHTDHKIVFDAVVSCAKWFRYPYIHRVLAYETLSETDFGLNPDNNSFVPNVFVNIGAFIDKKIEIMKVYESEIAEFPFPRSVEAILSLAKIRGCASGYHYAEAFMLLKERW